MSLISAITALTAVVQSIINPWNSVCNTPACQNAAKIISSDMSEKWDPCENFYRFTCSSFIAYRNQGKICRLADMQDKINEQIKSFLQENPTNHEPEIFRSVKRLFQMCMDEKKMDARGKAPGVAMLEQLGGWPVLGNMDPAKWSFVDTVIRSWKVGLKEYSLIELWIGVDLVDHTKYVFKVEQPELPIPKEFLIEGKDKTVVNEYSQYMVDMAILFGASRQNAEKAMKSVLELQIKLAKILATTGERQGMKESLKQFTLKELDKIPNKLFNWRKLFQEMVSPMKLQDDQKIDFNDLEIIQKILALIDEYPAETVANYVMWNLAIKLSPYLTTEMRNQNQKLEKVLNGINGRQPRWKECVEEIEGLGLALSAIYVNKFFDKSSRNKAKAITDQIQKEMDRVLREADWIDKQTREKAQKKSAKILHMIGYPDELADMAKVQEHYKELKLNKEHFFEARIDLNTFLTKVAVRKLNEVSDKRPWKAYSMMTSANAFYAATLNSIVAPAAFLQQPFFSASVPSYLNYANIGFAMGHEITHAFDDEGREFNEEGELNNWWDKTSLNKFNKKKECFIDQYSSFVERVTQRRVNGVLTQGENIADNGGIKLAYRAYREVAKQLRKPEPGLPGLKHYNNDQLFFISFANSFCEAMPPVLREHQMLVDNHAPGEWRVNGMLMNMPQFAEVFGCDKGTPMNPREKCEVW